MISAQYKNERIDLSTLSTKAPPGLTKEGTKSELKSNIKAIGELQDKLYAQQRHSVLLVLQGMDASGKDGAVRAIFQKVTPSGIKAKSFKKPTDEEMAHDFLWRVHQHTPGKGIIQVFNRSHYEDVLIQRVHQWITEETVKKRYEHINNFEKLLTDSGTVVIKCFFHTSKEQQLIELNERLTAPDKHWKHNPNDFKEREHWDAYMKAYEDVFYYCSPEIPWHIIPADNRWYQRLILSKIVRETIENLKPEYPPLKSND